MVLFLLKLALTFIQIDNEHKRIQCNGLFLYKLYTFLKLSSTNTDCISFSEVMSQTKLLLL